jgi:hypothetical protein
MVHLTPAEPQKSTPGHFYSASGEGGALKHPSIEKNKVTKGCLHTVTWLDFGLKGEHINNL